MNVIRVRKKLKDLPPQTTLEDIKAALAELQEREARRDPKWKPKHDLRKSVE